MKKVEQLVSRWSLFGVLHAQLAFIAGSLSLLACTNAHVESSTETGNPPVIHVDKVALVVASQSVRVVGQAGAVSPGGVAVEITIVGTNEVVRATSKADGSFDIPLSTSSDPVVQLRAADGSERSGVVYVTRGGATVGTGADAALSCMQRTNLASQAVGYAASRADTSCQSAADCQLVSNKTVCTDSCGDLLLASSAVASIQSAIDAVDQGLCADFRRDGCSVIALPCPAPNDGPIACVAGQCTQLARSRIACPSCLSEELSWGPSSGLSTNTLSGCEELTRTNRTGPGCTGKVAHCGMGGAATIEDLIGALADPDVEQALASGGIVGGPPAPGGLSTNVTVAGRSFVISNCGTGSTCAIPQGVLNLRALLDRVATETQCEPQACPPNAIYVKDYCVSCGPAGGCSEVAERCGIVCSDSSQCASNAPGTSCSARGICEAAFCI